MTRDVNPRISGEENNLPEESEDERRGYEVFSSAREFIRTRFAEDGCVVGIGEVLEHLDDRFGEAAGITGDVGIVLNLCVDLWADPHVDRVPGEWIDFCWNEEGDWPRECSQDLLARLQGRSDREEPR